MFSDKKEIYIEIFRNFLQVEEHVFFFDNEPKMISKTM